MEKPSKGNQLYLLKSEISLDFERGICEKVGGEQKYPFVFKNSSPIDRKTDPKIITRTRNL